VLTIHYYPSKTNIYSQSSNKKQQNFNNSALRSKPS